MGREVNIVVLGCIRAIKTAGMRYAACRVKHLMCLRKGPGKRPREFSQESFKCAEEYYVSSTLTWPDSRQSLVSRFSLNHLHVSGTSEMSDRQFSANLFIKSA